MIVKTIITDLDGTLLNNQNKISPKTKEALIQVQKQGIKLILASGRSTNAMKECAKELRFDEFGGLLISYNGACILDYQTNTLLYSKPLNASLATDILRHVNAFDVACIVNDETHVYVHDVYGAVISLDESYGNSLQTYNVIEGEARSGNYLLREVNDLAEFVDWPLYKILVVSEAEKLKKYEEELIAPFKNQCTALFSSPYFLEFTHQDVEKGITIKNELPKLGYDLESMIAFGDGMNDISMLKNVGVGVAMSNADTEVQQAADFITKSNNDDDGIVHVLHNILNVLV